MRCLLFFPTPLATNSSRQTGFTLIELLVVITLLAIVASIAVTGYDDVSEQARIDTTKFEMAELRKALLQFRRDNRELPCRVYRDGTYSPDKSSMVLNFDSLAAASPTREAYDAWCMNQAATDQLDSGLSILNQFPYDTTAELPLLWNPDTKLGWNGPYINNQGITDGWGKQFILVDPELDYGVSYRCENDGSDDYAITAGLYKCINPDHVDWDEDDFTKDANIARVVSVGPDGQYDGLNLTNPCQPATDSDDLVLCLLK
ncbi:MAG: hypothetical protein COA90_02075 [Gammaproteobacteria bacterium]|nr:MAG: hypothetical protein COA90_02075 [Gammaproteobacteria bacterium]